MLLANFRDYLSQLNWLIVIFTLLVFTGLIKLGLWQSTRAVEKEQRLTRIEAFQNKQALTIDELNQLIANNENINDIPLTLTGSFDNEHAFLIDNQTHKGRLGYRVVQVMEYGSSAVLVNLGWIEGFIDRSKLPAFDLIEGVKTIKGNVRLIEKGIVLGDKNFQEISWPLRVQQIELDKFSLILGQKLLPFVLYLDKTEVIGFEKNWRPIVMPPEKHRAYAFQWFSLATAWMILMLCASIWFYRNKHE